MILLRCRCPTRCQRTPAGSSGTFASASWTRFSPRSVTPGGQGLADALDGERLGDGDERHGRRVAPGAGAARGDLVLDGRQPGGDVRRASGDGGVHPLASPTAPNLRCNAGRPSWADRARPGARRRRRLRPRASRAARTVDWIIDAGRATPCPAMSKAVPWSTEVRTMGKPEADVDPFVEADHLDRDVPLVVVHRHHGVELPAVGPGEDGVRGPGAAEVPAPGSRRRRWPGRSPRCSWSPKSPPSPAWGLSPATATRGAAIAEAAHRLPGQVEDGRQALRRHQGRAPAPGRRGW